MNRKIKLKKIHEICEIEVAKCENILEKYEYGTIKPTLEDAQEADIADRILEVLVQIVDIIE